MENLIVMIKLLHHSLDSIETDGLMDYIMAVAVNCCYWISLEIAIDWNLSSFASDLDSIPKEVLVVQDSYYYMEAFRIDQIQALNAIS